MPSKRNPSGLPRERIVKQMYLPPNTDLDRHVGSQHEGFVRVRRTLVIVALAVLALVAVLVVTGNTDAASGIAIIMLAPVAFFALLVHVLVVYTDPARTRR